MKRYKAITIAMAIALTVTGCKTDEEPDWNAGKTDTTTQTPSTPEQNQDPSTPSNTASIQDIRLNELNGNGTKYIELYNTAAEEVDISGVQLRKDAETIVYVAPEGTKIAAKSILTLLADQPDYTTGFTSGLSAKKSVIIELLAPDDAVIDVFKNPSVSSGETWGLKDPKYNGEIDGTAYCRIPDGTGSWFKAEGTQGTSNDAAAVTETISW